MKKVFLLFLIFTLAINIYSCNSVLNNPEETTKENLEISSQHSFRPYNHGTIAGDYIFAANSYYKPVKYSIHDGKMSYLCPDPFCSHNDESCQFADVWPEQFAAIGNTVYYIKLDDETGKSTLYSFDADTSKTKTVYSCDGNFSNIHAYEYRLLIYYINGTSPIAENYYFWYDTKTGKTERLSDSYVPSGYIIYQIVDDRIIWKPVTGQEYYSTDLSGEDYKKHDFGYRYGNYYEKVKVTGDDGRGLYSVYVTMNGENERRLFQENIGPCFYYDNKIVYFKWVPRAEQKVSHTYENGSEVKDPTGGDVYVINPDGTDDHLLFHTDELIMGITADHAHPQICGDYIGIKIMMFDGDKEISDQIIIANINTGEFVVTHD